MDIKELKTEINNTKEKITDILIDFSNKTGIKIKDIEVGDMAVNGYGKIIAYYVKLNIDIE